MIDDLNKISTDSCTEQEVHKTLNMANVFNSGDYVSGKNLYFSRFGRIPNRFNLEDIDCKKTNEWLLQNYKSSMKDCFYTRRYKKRKGIYIDEVYYFLFDDLLIYLDDGSDEVNFFYRKTDIDLVDKIINEIMKFKKWSNRKKPKIELLVSSSNGLRTKTLEITSPKFAVEDNYNDDFLPVHKTILSRLQKKNDKGLVLLHGKPGTGKTSYLRYLITKIKKTVIFLPPNMAISITDPSLMNVLIDNPNSIFVIEDAENIIIDRSIDRSGSSSVSALLNLADGLLSDCLNIQIVCSFNTDLSRVDSALTRKGRLIAKYEFLELDATKAQALSDKLGFSSVINTSMTLAAIYNQHEMDFAKAQRKNIGFNIAV